MADTIADQLAKESAEADKPPRGSDDASSSRSRRRSSSSGSRSRSGSSSRSRSRSGSSSSSGSSRSLRRPLEEAIAGLGLVVSVADPYCGGVVLTGAERLARSLDELAKQNPSVHRMLSQLVTAGAWGGVLSAGAAIGVPIAMHHGLLPNMPGVATVLGQEPPPPPPAPGADQAEPGAPFFDLGDLADQLAGDPFTDPNTAATGQPPPDNGQAPA